MKQAQRHGAIIELLRLQCYVSTEELVEHFDVSLQTIRRDLNDLADQNWSYSGVRPLCDDEYDSPQAVTRDYTLDIQDEQGKAPLLSVFGGKLTTYRKLTEHAMEKLAHYYPGTLAAARREPKILRCLAATSLAIATATPPNCAVSATGCRDSWHAAMLTPTVAKAN